MHLPTIYDWQQIAIDASSEVEQLATSLASKPQNWQNKVRYNNSNIHLTETHINNTESSFKLDKYG